jgi:hypothetical protein
MNSEPFKYMFFDNTINNGYSSILLRRERHHHIVLYFVILELVSIELYANIKNQNF